MDSYQMYDWQTVGSTQVLVASSRNFPLIFSKVTEESLNVAPPWVTTIEISTFVGDVKLKTKTEIIYEEEIIFSASGLSPPTAVIFS